MSTAPPMIVVKHLGRVDYLDTWQEMRAYTESRTKESPDQLWTVEHNPVYTQGQAGKDEHVLRTNDIPIVKTDRGGQVTYHGPGQLVVYPLLDLKRHRLGVRDLVTTIENSVIHTLAHYRVESAARADAPGVYVSGSKIASLGLRVRRGCSFHGVAINLDMDLSPFQDINPCGYQDLPMTCLKQEIRGLVMPSMQQFTETYVQILLEMLKFPAK